MISHLPSLTEVSDVGDSDVPPDSESVGSRSEGINHDYQVVAEDTTSKCLVALAEMCAAAKKKGSKRSNEESDVCVQLGRIAGLLIVDNI